ncbi:MAG: hypothetical protein COA57_12480 [Flavobacteriales bacterium]|nr:type IX secretion system membrane protein PorP/SprF [Bacteroidales bacterium AH-315-I05]PCJ82947.1 MAG: hypothetical protein COA57_12480 [Flavobacteriales bacterium]
MKQILYVVFLMGLALPSFAQQDPLYNKYMFNPLVLNPAYAGSREALSAILLQRWQWVNFEGAPKTQTVSIHTPLLQKKVGIGLSIVNDVIGPTSTTAITGAYSYRVRLGAGKIAFGLGTGIYNYRFNWEKIDYKDIEYHPLLEKTNYWVPSFDFGMRFHTNMLYAGIAISHINQPTIGNVGSTTLTIDSVQYGSSLASYFTGTMGYAFVLSDQLTFKPSILFKATRGKLGSTDLNLSFWFKKALWVGVSLRTNYGLVFMAEYDISDNFRVGYSYDYIFNALQKHNIGSHELFIGYDLQLLKSKVLSPRYF